MRRIGLSAVIPAVLVATLVAQGVLVRRSTPVLPEAAGPRSGAVGDGDPFTLTVLGESTAAGVGVDTIEEGLAHHLAVGLAAATGRRVEWRLFARAGVTVDDTRRELLPDALRAAAPDLAVVVLGVNDTLALRRPSAWRRAIRDLVGELRAVQRPGARVVLTGVPDLSAFPALPRPLRDVLGAHSRRLDAELRGIADAVHVPLLDPAGYGFAADGFHPDAAAYRLWAEDLVRVLTGGRSDPSPPGA